MERQESNYSDMQSDIKRDLYSTNKPRKTQTWKSAAGDAHTRVMAEYLAEVPEEPKQVSRNSERAGLDSADWLCDMTDPQRLDLPHRCHHVYGCRCL